MDKVKIVNAEIPNMINSLINNSHVDQRTKEGFLTSILDFNKRYGYLTIGQFTALERMKNNYTVSSEWYSSFNDEMKENFKIVVDYYRQTRYFTSIISKVVKDAGYIPTPAEYRSICENKYAKILIEGYRAAPKYKLGEMVRMRNHKYQYDALGVGTVLDIVPRVCSAVRGNKIYKIYFVATGQTTEVEERHIALVRQKDYDKMASDGSTPF